MGRFRLWVGCGRVRLIVIVIGGVTELRVGSGFKFLSFCGYFRFGIVLVVVE